MYLAESEKLVFSLVFGSFYFCILFAFKVYSLLHALITGFFSNMCPKYKIKQPAHDMELQFSKYLLPSSFIIKPLHVAHTSLPLRFSVHTFLITFPIHANNRLAR